MNRIFSHGKLLLTSEYVVLDGALALAIPTKLGQEFFFEEKKQTQSLIFWESYCKGELWLNLKIDYQNWKILESNNKIAGEFILKILKKIQELSPIKFNEEKTSYFLKSNLEFPQNFGLGSSSTLITNLSDWANIDAYLLNEKILGGSGYDIAIAKKSTPILYQIKNNNREINTINFAPLFKDELLFIHLNQKQNSREGIQLYYSKKKTNELIEKFSVLTHQIISCPDIDSFSEIIHTHEEILSNFLGLKKAKELYFSDCPVFIKSLGAWGGDFIMTRKFNNYQNYFEDKGFNNIFTWDNIIL